MKNNLVKATAKNIQKAGKIIQQGGLVVFPTETVYGLGADAFNPKAVIRIFEQKQRPRFNPLIVHIAEKGQLNLLCKNINKKAEKLIKHFWPGPLTIILKKKQSVPDVVTAGLDTVAVRMPSHTTALQLIKSSGTPIAAPSANKFTYITPTDGKTVYEQLKDAVDLILDDGQSHIGIESTVISLVKEPTLLRPGGIPIEEIEKVIGKVVSGKKVKNIESPGQYKKHYSPHTRIKFLTSKSRFPTGKAIGLLAFNGSIKNREKYKRVKILSRSSDLHEAARNLFAMMYKLDKAGLDMIYVEKVPLKGIGQAIMDRLKKAVN